MANELSWSTLSEAYAFFGNSLLEPMTRTAPVGLDPAFWKAFPRFDDAVAEAADACARFAAEAVRRADEEGEDVVRSCAIEYTKLFVGPPSPAAPPWETLYGSENVTVGFGQATIEMRRLLREAGLEVGNENNQYEDHMGIELLYLSVLCGRIADEGGSRAAAAGGEGGAVEVCVAKAGGSGACSLEEADPRPCPAAAVAAFIAAHPLAWIGAFGAKVRAESPEGYFTGLMELLRCVLQWHARELAGAKPA